MSARPILYLIDGHAVAYRQFYAMQRTGFATRSGELTYATFGFTRTLLDIIEKNPRYLAVSFDMGMSGRDELYEKYKSTRAKMPDELRDQLKRIQEVVETFNIPVLAVDGYEADDVIGTVATQAEAEGVDVHIVTGDRDILQLLTPQVVVQLPKRKSPDVVYDEDAFREKYNGLEPNQLVDLKALMGDSSDNIPGVKGVGVKGGTNLLKLYSTLDGVYGHIDEIKGATHKKLVADREMAYLSQELATIQRDVPIALDLEACVTQNYDRQKVAELFRELEFRTLLERLPKIDVAQPAENEQSQFEPPNTAQPVKTVIVHDDAGLHELETVLNSAKAITWDVETTGTDQMAVELVGIALSVDGKTGYYVPVGHRKMEQLPLLAMVDGDAGTPIKQLPLQTVLDALRAPLTNPNIPKYAHNAAYDSVVMQRYGIDVSPIGFDTMVAEWVIDPVSKFLSLKNLAFHRLGVEMTKIEELIGKGKSQISMALVDIERTAPYAAADAVMTHRLVGVLRPDLEEGKLSELYETLELPFIPVITAMEQAGVVLDTDYLAQFSRRLAGILAGYQQEIYTLSGLEKKFNINSPKQLNDVLFDKLKLPVKGLRKTTHGYSTNAASLEQLKEDHPIVEKILQYREVAKLQGTYADALPQLVNPDTGRVHTSYNQTGTSTGRLSSSDPNLQNIPIRTELGREIRRAFVAPPGTVLLAVDYSQVELRILAHISQDETLLQAFRDGQDIHKATAAAIYGIPLEDINYEKRSFAKRINFGLLYGMGAYRLARESDLTLEEARKFIDTYFARLPGVKRYLDETKKQANEEGYVETLFGRRGNFRALADLPQQKRESWERAAINMPIQGTAADILKRAMINLYDELNSSTLGAKMILQVHDEVVLEVPEGELNETKALVVEVMEAAYKLDAPLVANAQVGLNWRDMEEM